MAADEKTAGRVRDRLGARSDVTERRMFGGLAFMVSGHMLCAIGPEDIMVRVGPDRYEEALRQPHAGKVNMTGRPMTGYVTVAPPGYSDDAQLDAWLTMALRHVTSLPPK